MGQWVSNTVQYGVPQAHPGTAPVWLTAAPNSAVCGIALSNTPNVFLVGAQTAQNVPKNVPECALSRQSL